jgi:hypothetical protein
LECLGAYVLEDDVDALLPRELAHGVLEPVGAIIDDVIGAERLRLLHLGIVAHGGEHRAADRFRRLDGDGANARAARVHQDAFARFELGVIEQHVLDRRERDRRAGSVANIYAIGHLHHQPRGHVDEIAGKPVDVETHDALHVLAQIVAALAACGAVAAGQSAIHHHTIAGPQILDPCPNRGDFPRGLRADDQRQLAPGESHAAVSPEIDVVERDGLHPHLHFARRGRRRFGAFGKLQLAIGDEDEGAHF